MTGQKLLLIYFSMTGQTLRAVRTIAKTLREEGHHVDMASIEPQSNRYRIPFSQKILFKEWVHTWGGQSVRIPVDPITPPLPIEDYDLVIIGFQTWFLEPSIPIASWLESPNAKALLKGKKVVSIVTARDAWQRSFQLFKAMVHKAGGEVVDNLALCSHNPTPQNFLLLYYMLFNGKNPDEGILQHLGTFGIGQSGENSARIFGRILAKSLTRGQFFAPTHLAPPVQAPCNQPSV